MHILRASLGLVPSTLRRGAQTQDLISAPFTITAARKSRRWMMPRDLVELGQVASYLELHHPMEDAVKVAIKAGGVETKTQDIDA